MQEVLPSVNFGMTFLALNFISFHNFTAFLSLCKCMHAYIQRHESTPCVHNVNIKYTFKDVGYYLLCVMSVNLMEELL